MTDHRNPFVAETQVLIVRLLILALTLSGCEATLSARPVEAARLAPAGEVMPPFGHSGYCQRHAEDCAPLAEARDIELTPAAWVAMVAVNDHVNRLPQVDDEALHGVREFWEAAGAEGGDCEDLALAKRRALVARGFPPAALFLATVRQHDGTLHAVLVARTDRGDFVLDNIEWAILAVDAAPYLFVKMQSGANPRKWFAIAAMKAEEAAR